MLASSLISNEMRFDFLLPTAIMTYAARLCNLTPTTVSAADQNIEYARIKLLPFATYYIEQQVYCKPLIVRKRR